MTNFRKSKFSFIGLLAIISVLFMIGSCSDRKLPSDLPDTHPKAWTDPASIDFHGTAVANIGLDGCTECHGHDLDGGEVEISCVECHLSTGHCVSCHGGQDNNNGAPPTGLDGETSTSELAVGAHTAHLTASGLAGAIACDFCHIVPLSTFDSSHYDGFMFADSVDSIAEINWFGYADGGNASWNRVDSTCTNTYCHGNFPGGYSTNAPNWTDNSAECGSCHSFETPEDLRDPHGFHVITVGLICNDCHASVIDSSLAMIDSTLHVNGVVDTLTANPDVCAVCHGVGEGSCITCHGGQDNTTGAPPVGLNGETETSELAVGAHTAHLNGKDHSSGYPCTTCHVLPTRVNDLNHLGADSIAELTWSVLAGNNSRWDRPSASCVDTYCHGNFSGGNRSNRPSWTGTDQATCGSCHDDGTDPASLGWKHNFHVGQANLSCGECHASMIDTLSVFTDLSLHANGIVDTLTRDETVCLTCHGTQGNYCTLCHGGQDNQTGAPPWDLTNNTSSDAIGVGAHTTHVEGGLIANAVDCSTCHLVPITEDEPEHREADQDNIAEITWSGLAGDSADWDRVNATCTDTYCHGEFAGGNGSNAPVWTGSNQAACGSCHDTGTNPETINSHHQTHVGTFDIACYNCHGNMVDEQLNITDRSLHVNGQADTHIPDPSFCETCHGSAPEVCVNCHGGTDNQSGAPPVGLRGETAVTSRAVGAHSAHIDGRIISDGIACEECHIVPVQFTDIGHYDTDSIAEINWGTLAGINGSWDRNAQTCTDTYCHGDFRGGTAVNQPVWNETNQADCGSCHDNGTDPVNLRDEHYKHVAEEGASCADCHAGTVNNSLIISGTDLHINGLNDIAFSDGNQAIWNGTGCSNNSCHEDKDW